MLHTTIDKAKGNIPVDALESDNLPKADYYALGHLHIHFEYENLVYPGPVFPNNFAELEDLQQGSFYIVDTNSNSRVQINISSKEIVPIKVNVKDAVTATEKILSEFEKRNLQDKIVLLRLSGELEHGKISDIQFTKIEKYCKRKRSLFFIEKHSRT
jgi:DNA repair exonuclease SbcCD nuclease subunit